MFNDPSFAEFWDAEWEKMKQSELSFEDYTRKLTEETNELLKERFISQEDDERFIGPGIIHN